MSSPAGVLITRPEPGASATAGAVAALGWRPVLAPLLTVQPLAADLPAPSALQAILVTSANALNGLPERYRTTPLFAVGDATAARARMRGFGHVESADGDAVALAALVQRRCRPDAGALLLASGLGQGGDLAHALAAIGFRVGHHAVYQAAPVETLPIAAQTALTRGELAAALFFSAETASVFINLAMRQSTGLRTVTAIAIGERTAMALKTMRWRSIRTARRPTQNEMLALLI